MADRAAEPTIKGEGYADMAVPQETPDRTLQKAERQYTVVGPRAVFGLEPGSTGALTLTEGEARALIEAGHLVPAEDGHSADNEEVADNG